MNAARQFDKSELSTEECNHFKFVAITNAKFLVDRANLDGKLVQWMLRSNESSIQLYKGIDSYSPKGSSLYMSILRVSASFEQVIAYLKEIPVGNPLYQDSFESALLYSLTTPTFEEPYDEISISWRGFKSPLSHVVAERDACLLECHHEFNQDGARGYVLAIKSTRVSACPDVIDDFVRLQDYGSGIIVMEDRDDPSMIQIQFIVHQNLRGSLIEASNDSKQVWLNDTHMMRRCRGLLAVVRHFTMSMKRHCVLCLKESTGTTSLHQITCFNQCGTEMCPSCFRACCALQTNNNPIASEFNCITCYGKFQPQSKSTCSSISWLATEISTSTSDASVGAIYEPNLLDTFDVERMSCATNDSMSLYSESCVSGAETVIVPIAQPKKRFTFW